MAQDDQAVLEVTARTRIRRFPPRGHHDKRTIWGILDKAVVAHIGFTKDDTPAMLPMIFFRKGDHVYFHGAQKNRMFGSFTDHPQVCLTATVIDGFVAARAALHHSMNYRSVIIYGTVEEVADPVEKLDALKGLIERFYPNRWDKIRRPSESEFSRVSVYRLPIQEASAKIRNAFPPPMPEEMDINVWAGVVPIETRIGVPILDPHSNPDTALNQDFSRIAEILRPSDGADQPGPPKAVKLGDEPLGDVRQEYVPPAEEAVPPAQAEAAPSVRPRQVERPAMPHPAAEAKTVATAFILADGSRQDVDAKVGLTLMEAATAAGVPGVVAECGGSMACATCHVYVDPEWLGRLPPPAAGESGMLDYVEGGRREGSRLSCQIKVTDDMEGFRAAVPEGQR